MDKILVLGDVCVDINYYGEVTRISPEAPIPIFKVLSKEEKPGMAQNVAQNVQNAGNETILYSKNDIPRFNMTIKSRYFARNHYLYRIDEDESSDLMAEEAEIILEKIRNLKDLKAVILQDYNKGFFNSIFVQDIIYTIRQKDPRILIVADGYKTRSPSFYQGVDYLKLNEDEYATLSKKGNIFEVPKKALIVTKGAKGAVLKYPSRYNKHFYSFKVDVKDVTGAGDTFTAWFTSEMVKTNNEEQSMKMANKAAAVSVTKLGCFAPSREEVDSLCE